MNIRIISFTDRGQALSQILAASFVRPFGTAVCQGRRLLPYASVRTFAEESMAQADLLVFIGATESPCVPLRRLCAAKIPILLCL